MDLVMTFPICKAEDIVTMMRTHILSEAEGKSISESDILQPKAEVMQHLYMRLLQSLCPLRNENFFLNAFTENVYEYMEGTIFQVNLFVYMEKFMPLCKVYDFKKKDLNYPTPRRTLRFWSAVNNFLNFHLSRSENFQKQAESLREEVQHFQKLKGKNEELKIRIDKIKKVPAQLEAEITPLSAEVAGLQETVDQDLKKTVTKLGEDGAIKKCELAEKTKLLNDMKVDLATAKENQALLRSQIVECPEQLKEELRRLKDGVLKLKSQKAENSKRLCELSLRVKTIQDILEYLEVCLKMMEECQRYFEEKIVVFKHLEKLGGEVDMNVDKLRTLTAKEDHLQQAQATRQDQRSTIQLKAEKRKQENEKEFLNWLGAMEKLEEKRKANIEQVDILHDRKHQLEEQQVNEMRFTQNDKRKVNEKFNGMLQAMNEFHADIFTQLEKHKMDQAAIWEKRNKLVESLEKILSKD
uniref:Kinetochore protein Nuf2 n=1 Tax=Petromyzon marinus TaxID=7757 RepID=A0AAJ7TPU9_PETMA|nr:kinetochore protein Nuf2 [Petromyzon marinus]XP_032820786.1 kinetochore protein Nuf2 [Petromyzon marinus]